MKGCTFKRILPSGKISWGYVIDAGRDRDGHRKQIFKSGFELQRDADAELGRRLNEQREGELITPDTATFAGFLNEWFREHAPRRCTPKTIERYRQLAAYVLPDLGQVRIQELSALVLERVFNRLKDSGGWDRKASQPRPLSGKTVHHIAGVVHVIFEKAIKLKVLKVNPMDGVELPPVEPREARALDADQLTWYLDAARPHGLYELFMFLAATGARRGEGLALSWPALDLAQGAARISKSLEQTREGLRLKETKSRRARIISLPLSLVALLIAHRAAQQENRDAFGPDYRTDLDLVFCDPQGGYLKPDSVSAKACLLARKIGLKGVGLHTLRHSHASQLLSRGVSLPTVSKRLGHANPYTTATIYSHSLPKDDLAAAELWDGVMKRAAEASSTTQ